jgi:hypothetical protein
MTDQPRCDTCKHWNDQELPYAANIADVANLGVCQGALQLWDCSDWADDEASSLTYRKIRPESMQAKSYLQDGAGCRAELRTRPDFYCASHEIKEN